MNSSAQELPIDLPTEVTDGPFPLGGIIGTWFGFASFYFIMSLAGVGRCLSKSEEIVDRWELGIIALLMGFGLIWGVVAYFGSQRQPWAIHCGFWLSILGGLPPLWVFILHPLYEIAVNGEWLYVAWVSLFFLLILATTLMLGSERFAIPRWPISAIYALSGAICFVVFIEVALLFMLTPNSRQIASGAGGMLTSFFAFGVHVWPRYCLTCRELARTPKLVSTSIS